MSTAIDHEKPGFAPGFSLRLAGRDYRIVDTASRA